MSRIVFWIKYVFLFIPLEVACKLTEKYGVIYGLLNYSFHKGKARARKVYDKLEKG